MISSTNRAGSRTRIVAETYYHILKQKGVGTEFLSLEDLPNDFLVSNMYGSSTKDVDNIVESKIKSVDKYIFVMPEYNGGYPGILKLFIDGISPVHFYDKKAGLVGLSSGKQGNSRGMDAFTNILNYMRVNVLYKKPKLSNIETLIIDDKLIDQASLDALHIHADEFIRF